MQFRRALTIILIAIAAVVSIIVETNWMDRIVQLIVFVVVVNDFRFSSGNNAWKSTRVSFAKMASPKAKVIREGNIITINAK